METTPEIKNENEKKEFHSFYKIVRRMMLAGIGAVALKHDELEEFIDKLVERGEIAKKDGENLLDEMKEHRKKFHSGEESHFHHKASEFVEHFNVPTKKDMDELNEKITALEKKIEDLSKPQK